MMRWFRRWRRRFVKPLRPGDTVEVPHAAPMTRNPRGFEELARLERVRL